MGLWNFPTENLEYSCLFIHPTNMNHMLLRWMFLPWPGRMNNILRNLGEKVWLVNKMNSEERRAKQHLNRERWGQGTGKGRMEEPSALKEQILTRGQNSATRLRTGWRSLVKWNSRFSKCNVANSSILTRVWDRLCLPLMDKLLDKTHTVLTRTTWDVRHPVLRLHGARENHNSKKIKIQNQFYKKLARTHF